MRDRKEKRKIGMCLSCNKVQSDMSKNNGEANRDFNRTDTRT